MAENIEMKAKTRSIVGKAKRRMASDELAAVVYGHGSDATPITLDRHEFEVTASHDDAIFAKVIHLSVDDHKPINVIIKAVQRDPTKGNLNHVDFWAIRMTKPIQTSVAVHFLGEAPGVKTGGVMMHNLSQLLIEALPADLPESLEIDISGLHVGDSVHVSDVAVPKGVTILDALDEIVASVVPPAKSLEEEAEEAAAAAGTGEPVVIGEETPEGE